jgi:5-methyltetrahydrofolate--homocysteine methyltransferase
MAASQRDVFDNVVNGSKGGTEAAVRAALDSGLAPEKVLSEGLIAAMSEVGDRFERGEYYVPEMLVAARAMQSGLGIIKPYLAEQGAKSAGKVVIGTVRGDLHDIGKNLVGMMLEGAGFEIIDLGTDVAPEVFAGAIKEHNAELVGMSALLTTTMQNMRATVDAIERAGLRGQVKIMIGGAPINDAFAEEIRADGYAQDASRAVKLAHALLGR